MRKTNLVRYYTTQFERRTPFIFLTKIEYYELHANCKACLATTVFRLLHNSNSTVRQNQPPLLMERISRRLVYAKGVCF